MVQQNENTFLFGLQNSIGEIISINCYQSKKCRLTIRTTFIWQAYGYPLTRKDLPPIFTGNNLLLKISDINNSSITIDELLII